MARSSSPDRLIDLHCHILPALDDGARDLRDTVGMARQAEEAGIELVVATPHIRADHDVRIAELAERCAEVNAVLAAEALRVRIATGGEVAQAVVTGLTDDELRACSLGGGGRWILLEPAAGPLGDELARVAAALRARGFDVLLAHPERHLSADLFERLRHLVANGVLIQLTAAFAAHEHGTAMLRERLVHVLGSDAHSSLGGRPVDLSEGAARLREVPGLASHVDWITREAPRAIVDGRPLSAPYRGR